MLKCADGTLYTGITTELNRRLDEHNEGIGAKYTVTRRPVSLVYSERQPDRSKAAKREYAIKSLTRAEKLKLTRDWKST